MIFDKTAYINVTYDYYLIRKTDLEASSKEFDYKKGKWSLGLLVLPVKMRPFATKSGYFGFEPSFNQGLTFSRTMYDSWKKDFSFGALLYTGITSIKMDTLNSGGTTTNEQQNISAATFGLGVLLEKKGIQLSFMIGMDFPSGQTQKKWVYRNMPWFAIGVGFSVFKLQSSDNASTGTNSK